LAADEKHKKRIDAESHYGVCSATDRANVMLVEAHERASNMNEKQFEDIK
jgi:hypothetical protein